MASAPINTHLAVGSTRGSKNPGGSAEGVNDGATAQASLQLANGRAGDHVLVHEMLREAGRAPSFDDFNSWLDDPLYRPADRVVGRDRGRIVAHAHAVLRSCWFGGAKLPAAGLIDVALLPEYRSTGGGGELLRSVVDTLRKQGTVLSLVRTDHPAELAEAGWLPVRWQGCSQAGSHDILSHLIAQQSRPRRRRPLYHVRLWRHVELDGLMPIYRGQARRDWGGVDRSEAYWQWLLGRKAHDAILVATERKRARRGDEPIVGYAVTRGPRILEWYHSPGCELAGPLLLARACRDAVEQGHHTVTLHTAASDPLHELLITAGGRWLSNCREMGGSLMTRLLKPSDWVPAMYTHHHERARRADVALPWELGFVVDDDYYRYRLTKRSTRLELDRSAPADVRCSSAGFSALLLGLAKASCLRTQGELTASETTTEMLDAVFPTLLMWQSPFDTLRY